MNKVPLSEYPRMIMQRDSYMSLNGFWEYAIRQNDDAPATFDGEIVVPFSPESPLSGVNRTVGPNDYLFYRKVFTLPADFLQAKLILHFAAVDQVTSVFFNGKSLGSNKGGFLPFSFVIDKSDVRDVNTLMLIVRDFTDTHYHSRGKQKIKRGNIWYTPQSGIYMPVWLESVAHEYVTHLKITPLYDENAVEIVVFSGSDSEVVITFDGNDYKTKTNEKFYLKLKNPISWTPNNPHLYPFVVRLNADVVSSYFALRKIHVANDNDGIKRIYLNNKVLFQSGLLDQGYYHEGYLTPPDDEHVISDIIVAKRMGFNVLRKHIKIEWERFYYHCDRLGMLVWQDFVNGGRSYKFSTVHIPAVLPISLNDEKYRKFGRQDKAGRDDFYDEVARTIKHLYNYPSIILWTVFNEGWGQFDAKKLLPYVEKLDSTRLIDITSGWHDQKNGVFKSLHVYFRKYRHKQDKRGRAVILSEFGGYSQCIEGHAFTNKNFGYRHYQTKTALTNAFIKLYKTQIRPAIAQGLCAAIYTQLSDVEDEVNGLITYDRKVIKIDVDIVAAINHELIDEN